MALLDDFTGVNGTALTTHDSNWALVSTSATDAAQWTIQSNELQAVAFRDLFAYRTDSTTDTAECTYRGSGSDVYQAGPAVRMAASNEGYALVFSLASGGNFTRIQILKNGAFFAQVTGLSYSTSADHSMKIVATQNGANVDLEAFINDVSVYSGTDSSSPLAAGNDGLYMGNRNFSATVDDFKNGAASGFTIDTEPTETRATEQGSFVISGPATAPTTLNTTIQLVDGTGPSATIDSVTGSDPYTINYTFPKTTNKLFNSTGYVHRLTVDAEVVDSSVIPYLPETDWDFVTLGTVDTGTDIYTEYAGSTWVSGDQAVWDTLSTPDGATVSIDNTLNWDISPAPTSNQTVGIYRIAANDTKDVDDTMTFVAGIPTGSRGSVNQIAYYLMSTGNYSSTQVNDIIKEWLTEEGYVGALNDMLNKYLGDAGYTGTIQDRMIKWSKDV